MTGDQTWRPRGPFQDSACDWLCISLWNSEIVDCAELLCLIMATWSLKGGNLSCPPDDPTPLIFKRQYWPIDINNISFVMTFWNNQRGLISKTLELLVWLAPLWLWFRKNVGTKTTWLILKTTGLGTGHSTLMLENHWWWRLTVALPHNTCHSAKKHCA